MTLAFTTTIAPNGIAELKFNLPGEKVNTFTVAVLEEMEKELSKLATNTSIKALKITSGKENSFIAGANLHSFEPAFKDPSLTEPILKTGHRVFKKISSLPFPTIAIVHGTCLGGGLECALSCTYRIVTDHPKTQLGLPEVNLGIMPGWGGTQRAPRLLGLSSALSLILSGSPVNGIKAYKMHLADAILPYEFLQEKSEEFIAAVLTHEGKKKVEARRKERSLLTWFLDKTPPGGYLVFNNAKKSVLEKTKGHYPAPLIALDVIEKTHRKPLEEGLQEEVSTFLHHLKDGFALSKELIHLFFTQEALKKETGAPPGTPIKTIKTAGVLGAGIMGAGIGWLLADRGHMTRLKDISWDFLATGLTSIKSLFDKGVKNKKLSLSEADRRYNLVSGTIDFSGFSHADLVIEAATENLELKKKLFQETEANVKEDAILATNTSSLTVASMADALKHPERLVGMHFFNPVPKMPLVEVVAGPKSSPSAVASIVQLCKNLGKTPIVVKDCHGFLVNRIFMMGANESFLLMEEGYSCDAIDEAMLQFGMPMGARSLSDEVGIDVIQKVSHIFEKAYGERMHPAKLLDLLVEKGFIGKKKGIGFYTYKGSKKTLNESVEPLIASFKLGKTGGPKDDILPRFLFSMINEAARCLEEKVVENPAYLDLALVMGIGFPPFQGGLLRYADRIGSENVLKKLNELHARFGMRFEPAKLIKEKAAAKASFY